MPPEKPNDIMVSLVMVTYGHEKFIAQAIESILAQKTNFKVELLVSNDHSPDNTDEVVEGLKNKISGNFVLNYTSRPRNVGMNTNFIQTYKQASGKYIALLEGDDFWTDPNKLQKQVDLLEQNASYFGSFHLTDTVDLNGNSKGLFRPAYKKETFTTEDTFGTRVLFHTSSFVFRNMDYKISDSMLELMGLDMILFALVSGHGNLEVINEPMSAYRLHSGGITKTDLASHEKYHLNRIRIFRLLDLHFEGKYHNTIAGIIAMHQRMLKGKHPHTLAYRVAHKMKRMLGIKAKE